MRRAILVLAVLGVVGCSPDECLLDDQADAQCEATYLERCKADAEAMREDGEVYEVRTVAMACDGGRALCGCCMTEPDPPFPGGEYCWISDPQ